MKRFALFALIMAAQTGAQPPGSFEVAALKPSAPDARFSSRLDRAQFVCTAHTLMLLIQSAWPDLPAWRVAGGPGWINTDRWNLSATLPPGMPADQELLYRATEAMLRGYLAEQFRLKTHMEMREEPTYALTVAKGGPRLTPSDAGPFSARYVPDRRGAYEFRHATMARLASYLYGPFTVKGTQQPVDRPVFDKTGVEGYFDFTLQWTPDTAQPDPLATGPSIFTALEEQLGLKLQPQKSQVEFLVIDHAEKPSN